MEQLTLRSRMGVSDILIGEGLMKEAASRCLETFSPTRVHIVTDSNVAPLFLDTIRAQFSLPVSTTVFEAGEARKRLPTVETIYHDMLAAGMTRKDLVIALGGGVVGDIAGFAAATYLRGVSLCQMPTTLLAQVDSSIGGKTGVDLDEGKNLVGAFYQPGLVLIDPQALASLPEAVFRDGMAEVIKYGCISNENILNMVAAPDFRNRLPALILECVTIKRDVVEHDEQDTGWRMVLNFGHTIGHAAEKLGGYTELTHGQAVAIGMVAAMRLTHAMYPAVDLVTPLVNLLEAQGLPTEIPYDRDQLCDALLTDKKNLGGTIHFILVRKFGEAGIAPFKADLLRELIKTYC